MQKLAYGNITQMRLLLQPEQRSCVCPGCLTGLVALTLTISPLVPLLALILICCSQQSTEHPQHMMGPFTVLLHRSTDNGPMCWSTSVNKCTVLRFFFRRHTQKALVICISNIIWPQVLERQWWLSCWGRRAGMSLLRCTCVWLDRSMTSSAGGLTGSPPEVSSGARLCQPRAGQVQASTSCPRE